MDENLIEHDVMSFIHEYNLTQHAQDAGFLNYEGANKNASPTSDFFPSYSSLSRSMDPHSSVPPIPEQRSFEVKRNAIPNYEIEQPEPPTRAVTARRGARDGGLKAISKTVYDLVARKGSIKLNEVADYVVSLHPDIMQSDEQNIRRRVYDAVNVLHAVEIVSKDNNSREITWIGLPSNTRQDLDRTKLTIMEKNKALEEKKRRLAMLVLNYVNSKTIITRNKRRSLPIEKKKYSKVPFYVLNTEDTLNNHIEYDYSPDKSRLSLSVPSSTTFHSSDQVLSAMRIKSEADDLDREADANPFADLSPDVVSYIPALNLTPSLESVDKIAK